MWIAKFISIAESIMNWAERFPVAAGLIFGLIALFVLYLVSGGPSTRRSG